MNRDKLYLEYILTCISNIEELVAKGKNAFIAAKHDQAAVLYYLQTLSESTQNLTDTLKATQPQIDWKTIRAFRNVVVHSYLQIKLDLIWQVIEDDLTPLKLAVQVMLSSLDTQNRTE